MTLYQVWSTSTRAVVARFETGLAADNFCSVLSNAGDHPLLLIPCDRLNWEQGHDYTHDKENYQ
jgi:hypothetical protein